MARKARVPAAGSAALALVLMVFSGCLGPMAGEDDDHGAAPTLARVVVMDLDQDRIDELDAWEEDVDGVDDLLRMLLDVSFEYTHGGSAVPPSELTVRFTGEAGDLRADTLDAYTGAETLRAGDMVAITGVHLTSAVRVERDGAVLVEREPVQRDWFTLGGYPLPLAGSQDGEARWIQEAESSVGFSVRDFTGEVEDACDFDPETFEYHCETVQLHVQHLDFQHAFGASGTFSLGLQDGAGRLFFTGEASGSMDGSASFQASVQGETVAGALEGWGEAEVSFRADVDLEGRQVAAAGTSGRVVADGGILGWFEADGEREEIDLPADLDLESPLVDEEWDTGMEPVPDGLPEPDAMLVGLLESLWSVSLDVGDRFRFHFAFEEPGFAFSWSQEVTVTERAQRTVGGVDVPALRVVVDEDRRIQGFEGSADSMATETVMWLHADSYLPLHLQQEIQETMDADDLRSLIGGMGPDDMFPLDLDALGDADLVVRSRVVSNLEHLDTDLAVAGLPYAVPGGGGGGGVDVILAGVVFVLVSDLGGVAGGHSMDGAPWGPPTVSFHWGEDSSLVVTAVDGPADWWDFMMEGPEDLRAAVNGDPAVAGVGPYEWLAWSLPAPWGPTHVAVGEQVRLCRTEALEEGTQVSVRYDDGFVDAIVFMAQLDVPQC